MRTCKNFYLLLTCTLLVFSSCRTEETLTIDPPTSETVESNSLVADLMSKTALKDGSTDNIIDRANCLSIELPVTVVANGNEIIIENEEGYVEIEEIFDEFDDDNDTVTIIFPVTIILEDYTTITVNTHEELKELARNCKGENEEDDDIECIDFEYPIEASIFDEDNELIESITISSDRDLYRFVKRITKNVKVTLRFPIKLILANGASITVETVTDLREAIATAKDACDEDDDYDYNDDDCDNCDTDRLKTFFESHPRLKVDCFERNGDDIKYEYKIYTFSFNLDGTVIVNRGVFSKEGTWESTGTGNDMVLAIDIPELPIFNDTWNVNEIKFNTQDDELDLRKGDDKLVFEPRD